MLHSVGRNLLGHQEVHLVLMAWYRQKILVFGMFCIVPEQEVVLGWVRFVLHRIRGQWLDSLHWSLEEEHDWKTAERAVDNQAVIEEDGEGLGVLERRHCIVVG